MAHTDEASDFHRTVKNLLRMKPKPHEGAKAPAPQGSQSESAEEGVSHERKRRSNTSRDSS